MVALLQIVLNSIVAFFNAIWDWFANGLYDLVTWATAGFIEWWTLHSLLWALEGMRFAWGVARQILVDLNLSSQLAAAWSALPVDVAGLLTWTRIPEAVVMLLTACVTKYVLRFIPGV